MEIKVDIPALDRLCAILEGRCKAGLLEEVEGEIIARLKNAAGDGTLKKAAEAPVPELKEVPVSDDHPWKDEANDVPLERIQKACADLRDAGKLDMVRGLFPQFGIRMITDLTDAGQRAAFAGKLKELGAVL